jgi:hypothetical protein
MTGLLCRAADVGGQRLGDSVNDHDPLRVLTGKPWDPVDRAVDEGDPSVGAVHLDRDRPAGRQSVRVEVGIGSQHPLDATTFAAEHKAS